MNKNRGKEMWDRHEKRPETDGSVLGLHMYSLYFLSNLKGCLLALDHTVHCQSQCRSTYKSNSYQCDKCHHTHNLFTFLFFKFYVCYPWSLVSCCGDLLADLSSFLTAMGLCFTCAKVQYFRCVRKQLSLYSQNMWFLLIRVK